MFSHIFLYTSKMKFFILALIVVSIGSSASIKAVPTTKEKLEAYFKISEDDIKTCNADFETLESKLTDGLNKLQAAANVIAKEGETHYKNEDDLFYLPYVTKKCHESNAFQQIRANVIKTALPCLTDKLLADKVKYSLVPTCKAFAASKRPSTKGKLKTFFKITDADIIKCGADFKTLEPKLTDGFKKLQAATEVVVKKANEDYKESEIPYVPFTINQCYASEPVEKILTDIMKMALPCATQKELSAKMLYAKFEACV